MGGERSFRDARTSGKVAPKVVIARSCWTLSSTTLIDIGAEAAAMTENFKCHRGPELNGGC
jgi:hypothetical protein